MHLPSTFLNKVQEQQLKEIMKREKRPFSQSEVKKWLTDKINHIYLMES